MYGVVPDFFRARFKNVTICKRKCPCNFAPNMSKSHSWYGAEDKLCRSGKNPEELKVGADIPLKTLVFRSMAEEPINKYTVVLI